MVARPRMQPSLFSPRPGLFASLSLKQRIQLGVTAVLVAAYLVLVAYVLLDGEPMSTPGRVRVGLIGLGLAVVCVQWARTLRR